MKPSNKKLFIIRHGKSDWNNRLPDHDRPLNPRGKKDAPKMGAYLKRNYAVPDQVLCSTAKRAHDTAQLLLPALNYNLSNIDLNQNLYHASVNELLAAISTVPKEVENLYLFGHNPGLSDFVYYLSGTPAELKTCCVAVLSLYIDDWRALSRETCQLEAYLSPKSL